MAFQSQAGFEKKIDVVTLGETMALMKTEAAGPLAHASSLGLGIGGAESNVAIALSRLEVPVTWIGRLGADSLGDLVSRELRAEGVQMVCRRDSEAPTGLMIKERRTTQSVKVWYYRSGSAGSRLNPDDIPAEKIESARLLHLTGITPALSGTAAAAVQFALDCAKKAGTLVSFDINYRSALWPRDIAATAFLHLISQADVVFAGADEAAMVVGEAGTTLELASRLSLLGPSEVIIKLGAAGCLALVDSVEYQQAAIPVHVVDTVGAGDAFVAGYLSELLRGAAVDERLMLAVRTGAFACMVSGDWEGLPKRSDLALLDAVDPVNR